jgi:hypothetical protein
MDKSPRDDIDKDENGACNESAYDHEAQSEALSYFHSERDELFS